MKRSMRRNITIAGLALALVAAGCGSSGDEGSGGGDESNCPVDAFLEEDGTTEVVVWHSYVGKTNATLQSLAERYNDSQDKVKVTVEAQGNSYEELLRKYQAAIASNDLPGIMIGEDTNTQFMADSDTVLPAQDCIDADDDPRGAMEGILPAITNAYTVDDKILPASFNSSTIMLYINKDHFRQAGLDPENPPQTLAEVKEAAQAIKDANIEGVAEPFVFKMDSWFPEFLITSEKETMVNENNGFDDRATEGTIDNEAANAALEWYGDMEEAGLMNAITGEEGQINHYLAIATQSGSMLLETSTAITTVDGVINGTFKAEDLGQGDSELVKGFEGVSIELDIGVSQNPGISGPAAGQIGGAGWYITNTNSDAVQSAAWDFAKFINEEENQVDWTLEGSYLPIFEGAQENERLKEEFATTLRGKWLSTSYDAMLEIDPEWPGAHIGPYDKFRSSLQNAVEQVVLEGADPSTTLADAEKSVNDQLTEYADNIF